MNLKNDPIIKLHKKFERTGRSYIMRRGTIVGYNVEPIFVVNGC